MADLKNEVDKLLAPMVQEGMDQQDAVGMLLVALYAWAVDHRQLPRLASPRLRIELQVWRA